MLCARYCVWGCRHTIVNWLVRKIFFRENLAASSIKVDHPDVFNFELIDFKPMI